MFGVIAYVVSQRTGEMAVRQAPGATCGQILAKVLREGAGGRDGRTGDRGRRRVMDGPVGRRLRLRSEARDPFVLGASAAIVGLLAVAATVLPARLAARLDLACALRG
jgi:ABC-type antimicrobial peptide transport system permease subunit